MAVKGFYDNPQEATVPGKFRLAGNTDWNNACRYEEDNV